MWRWLSHPSVRGVKVDDPLITERHRDVLRRKVFLRRIYDEWYSAITDALPGGTGRVLELGSGAGFLADRIPDLIASDVVGHSGIRVVLESRALPVVDRGLRALVLVNVLHHLSQPRLFVREAARCVRPGGRLILIEPWVSSWSTFVYGWLHHEPFMADAPDWESPAIGRLAGANSALPWIMFERDRSRFELEFPQWRILSVRPMMPFRYLVSGGMSARSLTPAWSFAMWRSLEQCLHPWAARLAMFAHLVLERTDVPA